MHNGFLNTYSIFKGGKKITLVSLSPSELFKHKLQKIPKRSDILFTYSEPLLKAFYHEFRAFREWILATQEGSESPLLDHPIAKSLLKRFSHVFPEEIPSRLPPKGDIRHHIDLIPGSILPNKPT